jgi:hypothetical protein
MNLPKDLKDWINAGGFQAREQPRTCPWKLALYGYHPRWIHIPYQLASDPPYGAASHNSVMRNACTFTFQDTNFLALTRGHYKRPSYMIVRLSDCFHILFYRIENVKVFLDLLSQPKSVLKWMSYKTPATANPYQYGLTGDRAVRDDKTIAKLITTILSKE